MDLILKFACDEAGAPAVEYALLLAFIALAIIAVSDSWRHRRRLSEYSVLISRRHD